MKKLLFVLIIVLTVTLVALMSGPVLAERYEGQVVAVNLAEQSLVLKTIEGDQLYFPVAQGANLYYNNLVADLGMYQPVTESDFVNGYVETDAAGQIQQAKFYYLIREGIIKGLEDAKVVLEDVESGIQNSYPVRSDLEVSLNDSTVELTDLGIGMRVVMILDYQFRVKKVAAFHYDFVGFIEKIDLTTEKVVVNVGTRLAPNYQEYQIGGKVEGSCQDWASLDQLSKEKAFLWAKFLLNKDEKRIAFINICSL